MLHVLDGDPPHEIKTCPLPTIKVDTRIGNPANPMFHNVLAAINEANDTLYIISVPSTWVIAANTCQQIASIPLTGTISIDSSRNKVFLSDGGISVIDGSTNKIIETIP